MAHQWSPFGNTPHGPPERGGENAKQFLNNRNGIVKRFTQTKRGERGSQADCGM
jgi:hypothetical protein